jgi:hypothetical protein
MQQARAMVSRGSWALARIDWASGTKAVVKEVEDGMRFVRWVAGPNINFD